MKQDSGSSENRGVGGSISPLATMENSVPFKAGKTGNCPHCTVHVRFESVTVETGDGTFDCSHLDLYAGPDDYLDLDFCSCPSCCQLVLVVGGSRVIWPDGGSRRVPSEVESAAPGVASDFREACAVIYKSKKASAALSRRCLQAVLGDRAGVKKGSLASQLDEVITALPPSLASTVDAVRQVGNFAAHPVKSTNTGEIAEVEEGEAEWLLDVLEELFEFYFVEPARSAARVERLNKKLDELGKPPLKAPKNPDSRK